MSKRQQLKEQRQRQNRISKLLWGSGLVILVAIVGYFIWSSLSSPTALIGPVGEAVAVDPDRGHITDGSDPGPLTTNPPTSGHHYPTWLDAGFYDTNTYPFPQGYLVHNLEHGYVIFWYNCKNLTDAECSEMKTQVKDVMAKANNFKVIAYPWDSIENPLVMTSWGYMLPFETFDPAKASAFIEQHQNRAPEPEAP
jgi:hypothetical protein